MADLSGQTLGRYRIIEQLGEGGMATVYKAYDSLLEREVALKIIRREAFPAEMYHDVLKRFEREAKSLARLTHPNIVKVLDFGEHDGSPFIVMEYLSGGTLKQQAGEKIPWQKAVRLLLPVARGIDYAHRRGVIHRDIKPANILMTDDNEPTLSDFGIAKIFGGAQTTNLTGSGMAIGTPEYMAPEQWTGETTVQSDIYSLGVVLYEMITGRKPYVADTPGGILMKQIIEPLPAPRQFTPDLPEPVESFLIKALAKDKHDRYADMQAVITALEELLMSSSLTQPITPPPTLPPPIEAPQPVQPQDDGKTIQLDVQPTEVMPAIAARPAAPKRSRAWPKFSRKAVLSIVGALVIVIAAIAGFPYMSAMLATAPLPTATRTITPAPTLSFTSTALPPSATLEPNLTPTAAPLPTEIVDAKGVSMRLVPAGKFTMGSNNGTDDEKPVHEVLLPDFYMDVYEVTNTFYKACVEAGACKAPYSAAYDSPNMPNYPVVMVDWFMANAYCEWRDARLPTEAEWEKAARGTDGRTYPWGESIDNTFANYEKFYGLSAIEVGHYEKGKSLYGLYDMGGNVWEWVSSLYKGYPYNASDGREDLTASGNRVLRGGSWYNLADNVRSSDRLGGDPTGRDSYVGFRCAASVISTAAQPETTPTPTPVAVSGPLPTEIIDAKGVSMRLVPAGKFTMGNDNGDPDEKPAQEITLPDFYMDVYEVTNVLYRACESDGVCTAPGSYGWYTRSNYYGVSRYDNYPVINVAWNQANAYCQWRGARLPTEAEWEKAARGTDGRTYPWGEGIDSTFANYAGNISATTEVGKYEKGKSPYGLYDMAGNVWEWVSSLYKGYPYNASDGREDLTASGNRVLRGGPWIYNDFVARSSNRFWLSPADWYNYIGFRCARTP